MKEFEHTFDQPLGGSGLDPRSRQVSLMGRTGNTRGSASPDGPGGSGSRRAVVWTVTPSEVEMRRYDDPVEVRRGMVPGAGGQMEGPEQFLWRGRLWKVCAVVAHWVETGPWWQTKEVAPALGLEPAGSESRGTSVHDLLGEREVWRVEAARGLVAADAGRGVFDLSFDWVQGEWALTRCAD